MAGKSAAPLADHSDENWAALMAGESEKKLVVGMVEKLELMRAAMKAAMKVAKKAATMDGPKVEMSAAMKGKHSAVKMGAS